MTSVTRINIIPGDILERVGINDHVLKEASGILFYFKGGRDVICLKKEKDSYTVFIPSFSSVDPTKLDDTVKGLKESIDQQADELKIPSGRFFAFDTGTKKALTKNGFLRFVPYYTPKNAIFILLDEGGKSDGKIYFLSDVSDYGVLGALSLIVARMELTMPINGTWTNTGKMVLHYLIARIFEKAASFNSRYGSWDSVKLEFKNKSLYSPDVDLSKLNLSRAKSLAESIRLDKPKEGDVVEENPFENPLDKKGFENDHSVRLTDIVEIGMDNIISAGHGVVEVEIDMMREVFDSIVIDCEAGIAFIKKAPGCVLLEHEIRESLECETIQIVDHQVAI